MASVILPNPQEFNQAARDDRGRNANGPSTRTRAATPTKAGPEPALGDDELPSAARRAGFPSGAAITWETGDGRRVTSFRLASGRPGVPTDRRRSHRHGVWVRQRPLRPGAAPRDRGGAPGRLAAVKDLAGAAGRPGRGDVVDPSQARVHAKMRTVMGMGSTDESQRLAMQLLRRAQASKGIFSINALFKDFVLTEPLALTRWDVALEAYREASDSMRSSRLHAAVPRPWRPFPGLPRSTAPLARTTWPRTGCWAVTTAQPGFTSGMRRRSPNGPRPP